MLGIGMFLERFWSSKLNVLEMGMALVGGLLLIYPGWLTDVIGVVLVGGVLVWQHMKGRRPQKQAA